MICYKNVVLLKSTQKDLPKITECVKNQGVTPIGRFSELKYLWSNQTFLSGYNAVSKARE